MSQARCNLQARKVSVGFLFVVVVGSSVTGCLVSQRCFEDKDCPKQEICSAKGACEFECAVNVDCDAKFGIEFNCLHGRCAMAKACTACSVPHAEHTCVHGDCQFAGCLDGYFDQDRAVENGCECQQSNEGVEVCNGLDDDCDGSVDEALEGCIYDCNPSGAEVCNNIDDDCDGVVDEGYVCVPRCPSDMVAVGAAYCVDRYEASRADATATNQGTETTRAYSRPGVLPWMVNPMTAGHLAEFAVACSASGKHLCTRDEWVAACAGPNMTRFVYGDTFEREACNCVDTYCDDYCSEHGSSNCSTAENCGYSYNCFHEARTGSFPACTNDFGTLDINGNVWEVVPSTADSRGYEVRGGAFNCASPSARVSCEFNADWSALFAGFRCCQALE